MTSEIAKKALWQIDAEYHQLLGEHLLGRKNVGLTIETVRSRCRDIIQSAIDEALEASKPEVAEDVEACADQITEMLIDAESVDAFQDAYIEVHNTLQSFLTAHDAAKDAKIERLKEDYREAIRAMKSEMAGSQFAEEEIGRLRSELQNFVNAKRFDRSVFDNDTEFVEWVLSRSRNALQGGSDAPALGSAKEEKEEKIG